MADLRADLAALRAKVERMTLPLTPPFTNDEAMTVVALIDDAPAYLAALARIAEIVDIRRGMDDGLTLDEIRAVLVGAAEGGG